MLSPARLRVYNMFAGVGSTGLCIYVTVRRKNRAGDVKYQAAFQSSSPQVCEPAIECETASALMIPYIYIYIYIYTYIYIYPTFPYAEIIYCYC